ncbi:MAG TPA: YHS domain-containing (seleno)protein [Xanthobacteraceae bacterium]|jgi:hypothetical protein|nr:YHS domain-containing (seleno)protein [Xanthobacteraceae bacterium]
MTARRQERYGWRTAIAFFALLAGFLVPAASEFAARASTTERVVVNRFSGVAIDGFDPVAYFVLGQAVRGLEDFEAPEGGAVWRFHNEANRDFFVAHPEIYGPRFGGYDPIDVARGVTRAGSPRIWVISEQRLFLFGAEANRDAFAANPDRFLEQANARWPALQQNLVQ